MRRRINESNLWRLYVLNNFAYPEEGMVFFGLRGCLPLELDNMILPPNNLLSQFPLITSTPAAPWDSGYPKKVSLHCSSEVPRPLRF